MRVPRDSKDRLYQSVVRQLGQAIEAGAYPVGTRLPSERDLAEQLGVSRPVVREAIVVLQNSGMVEIRHGAGVFVRAKAESAGSFGMDADAGPFEVIEARRLLEGEVAALAAELVTDRQIAELETLLDRLGDMRLDEATREQADRAFHLALARVTGNDVLVNLVEMLWDIRYQSSLCAYFFKRARDAGIEPVVDEHRVVLDALKARDPEAARKGMRDHLALVTKNLLIATEEDVRERARLRVEERRFDFARRAGVSV
ncbi:FadR family transcriptional regulator [Sphingomonas piscis]|uniref:FadR family transcriptional regulator n=1 Tax=Sphingomonas piscis TaxID=2714943 RepID=A0A6G7YMS4_9SPHN|nr:FadR/GntR family transcriptional regulator [Sphingomonas piscis]QIK78043.1 FadR family transcriptional regulator [Sphingomonas piscis]